MYFSLSQLEDHRRGNGSTTLHQLTVLHCSLFQCGVRGGGEQQMTGLIHQTALVKESLVSHSGSKPRWRINAFHPILPDNTQRTATVGNWAHNESWTQHLHIRHKAKALWVRVGSHLRWSHKIKYMVAPPPTPGIPGVGGGATRTGTRPQMEKIDNIKSNVYV